MTTRTATPMATRSFSTRELQAAAAALAAGRFSEPTDPSTSADDAAPQTAAGTAVTGLAPLVRVRAANAGAGASTITLALADAADAAGVRTRVLDAAAPAWSGLLGATATELGAAEGWRRGRRGTGVLIDRVADRVRVPADVPAPRPTEGMDLTVLDTGWSLRELAAAGRGGLGTWLVATPARVEVIVTRPHAPALSQAEAALAHLEEELAADQVVVVVVGASRWRDREAARDGRHLRKAHEHGAVLLAPLLGVRALPGLGPDPLPKQLTTCSQRLLERVATITGPLPTDKT